MPAAVSLAGSSGIANRLRQLLRPPEAPPRPTTPTPDVTARGRIAREAAEPLPADAPRRYELDLAPLIDRREGGEIREMGLSAMNSDRPERLAVMREVGGLRKEWRSMPLPGLEAMPPYLNCRYELADRSGEEPRVISRQVKFWFGQRPGFTPAVSVDALKELQLADVALQRCPLTWGDALTAALGPSAWAQIQTRERPAVRRAEAPAAPVPPPPAEPVTAQAQAALQAGPAVAVADVTPEPEKPVVSLASLPPIPRCDHLAAHPDDPEAHAKGVADADLDAAAVVSACEEAVKQDKNSPRLAFQLARGYLASDRMEAAIERLIAAAKQGHGASLAYLADIHLDGAPGIEPDPRTAHALYQRALESGFEPAAKVLAEFADFTEQVAMAEREEQEQDKADALSAAQAAKLPKPKLKAPELIDNIMARRFEAISADESYAKAYLTAVADTLYEECSAHFTAQEVKDMKQDFARIQRLPGRLMPSMPSFGGGLGQASRVLQENLTIREKLIAARGDDDANREEDVRLAILADDIPLDGMNDGFFLILKHGCGSPALDTFKKNAWSFVTNEWAPEYQFTSSIDKVCVESAKKAGHEQAGRQQCECLVNANTINPKSQKVRKDLYEDYWPVTQRLIRSKPGRYSGCGAR
ncbi:hypothetical protein ACG02S_14330 [Roseateles sp. DC23W]|uniref:Sel1 repeat family protein n=2 Tax=Pelomonas dachongensis TaxID=3299029 RepID=A0ABW7ER11_9BURK